MTEHLLVELFCVFLEQWFYLQQMQSNIYIYAAIISLVSAKHKAFSKTFIIFSSDIISVLAIPVSRPLMTLVYWCRLRLLGVY